MAGWQRMGFVLARVDQWGEIRTTFSWDPDELYRMLDDYVRGAWEDRGPDQPMPETADERRFEFYNRQPADAELDETTCEKYAVNAVNVTL